MSLDGRVPGGPMDTKWERLKAEMSLVNPANRRKYSIVVVGTGLAGASSDKRDGIRIQVYCTIIACMLLSLWTGRKPTLATLEMFYWYFVGLAEEDELEAHLAKLKSHPA